MEKTSCATQLGHPGLSLASISLRELAFMNRGKGHLTQVWMSHPPRPSFCFADLTASLCCWPESGSVSCHAFGLQRILPLLSNPQSASRSPYPDVWNCQTHSRGDPLQGQEWEPAHAVSARKALGTPHQHSSSCSTCEHRFKVLHHPSQFILKLLCLVLLLLLGQPYKT